MSEKALAPGSLVLITGVNGYIAGHVADLLLSKGYKIRGTARDQAKVDIAAKAFEKYPGQFEGVILKNVSSHDAFASVVKGCDGVIHVASDLSFGYDPNDIVTNTIKAMENVLAAIEEEPKVKRLVYTSSTIAAVELLPEGSPAGTHVNASSWNQGDVDRAWAPPPYTPDRAVACYAASKIGGEKAAWKFIEEKKPHFVFNTVLPGFCIGPAVFPNQNLSTSGWVQGLYEGKEEDIQRLQNFPPVFSVDVRDIARLHVAGLLEPDIVSQRILAAVDPTNYKTFVDLFDKINPKHAALPPAPEGMGVDRATYDVAPAESIVKRFGRPGLTHVEESIRDQIAAAH